MRLPALLLALLTAGACAAPTTAVAPTPTPQIGVRLSGGGEFSAKDPLAIVYNTKLVPEGAKASVTVESADGQTRSSFVAEGLLPNRAYGVHLHANPCGSKPDDSGPHFQHTHGTVNASNEVWLDIKTDGSGAATSTARQPWALSPDRVPHSLVIHEKATAPDGTAGGRVACLTLK
ncbi:superoxide dismutase family protein [Nonomuraea sp. NPDC003804]|uniref:superoxide dismutase family protein n=1 Tax=Nonomuraea sp. NPDC003804 TaxID=3154547 RepID=UPI0033AEF2CE